jgi:hypothetical protein
VLSPALHQAFDEMQFPNGFTDIQYYGIPEVLKRKDTILASQTGTGASIWPHAVRIAMVALPACTGSQCVLTCRPLPLSACRHGQDACLPSASGSAPARR